MGNKRCQHNEKQLEVCRIYSNYWRIESLASCGRKWEEGSVGPTWIVQSFPMVFSKSIITLSCRITVHGQFIEQSSTFIYMWSKITSDRKYAKDGGWIIDIAKSSFSLTDKVLKDMNTDLKQWSWVLKCYSWSRFFMELMTIISYTSSMCYITPFTPPPHPPHTQHTRPHNYTIILWHHTVYHVIDPLY